MPSSRFKRLAAVPLGVTLSFAVLALAAPASLFAAQEASPAAAAPAGATTGRVLAAEIAGMLEANYVFAEDGARYARALREHAAAGRYDRAESDAALAELLTADLKAVKEDRHLKVSPPAAGAAAPAKKGALPESIDRIDWIAPGAAYIAFNRFTPDEATVGTVEKFLADYAGAETLIIDVRQCRGGTAHVMEAMLPHLYAAETKLVAMEMRAAVVEGGFDPLSQMPSFRRAADRPGFVSREHYVTPAGASPLQKARIFYLTSKKTASACEHFALALKRTGRATLVGEATSGANHFGFPQPLAGGFKIFMPVGRTFDPDTGKDWELTGVAPDVAVPAEAALDEALRRAAGVAVAAR